MNCIGEVVNFKLILRWFEDELVLLCFCKLGVSNLILFIKISIGKFKIMWDFFDYICNLIWLICYYFLEMY